jgi:hypothetical protein
MRIPVGFTIALSWYSDGLRESAESCGRSRPNLNKLSFEWQVKLQKQLLIFKPKFQNSM